MQSLSRSTRKTIVGGLAAVAMLSQAVAAFADTTVTVDPSSPWIGYMNVFNLNGTQDGAGGYVFGSPWGVADLVGGFASNVLTLSPNTNTYNATDPFWAQPNGQGNKWMDANFYVENDGLAGSTTTFNGKTLTNTLVAPYTSVAFIKEFSPNFNFIQQSFVALTTNTTFSLSLATTAGNHVQYGFETQGLDANPATVAALGKVTIQAEASAITGHDWTGLAGNGQWNTGSNWNGGVPNGAGAQATLGSGASSPTPINLATGVILGSLKFDNVNSYTLSGSDLTMQSSGSSVITVVQGAHTITSNLNMNDGSTSIAVSAGASLSVNHIIAIVNPGQIVLKSGGGLLQTDKIEAGLLNVQGGTVALKTAATPTASASVLDNLIIGSDGGSYGTRVYNSSVDVGTSDVIIRNGVLADIADMARAAQTGNPAVLFGANGLTSSVAAADATGQLRYAVGVIQNNIDGSILYSSFDGVSANPNDILVKFTYFGDADLNGIVDDTDFFLINNGYGNGLTGWVNGDFDYSGAVDDTDFFLINNAYGLQGGSLRAGGSVPEPTSMGLIALGAGAVLGRRRR